YPDSLQLLQETAGGNNCLEPTRSWTLHQHCYSPQNHQLKARRPKMVSLFSLNSPPFLLFAVILLFNPTFRSRKKVQTAPITMNYRQAVKILNLPFGW